MKFHSAYFEVDWLIVEKRAAALRELAGESTSVLAAVKGMYSATALEVVAPYVDGFDASNVNEIMRVLDVMINTRKQKLSVTGPYWHSDFYEICLISELNSFDCTFNFDSLNQIETGAAGNLGDLGIRLRPIASPALDFGFELQELREIKQSQFHVSSLHLHGPKTLKSMPYFYQAAERLIETKNQIFRNATKANLGGGLHALQVSEWSQFRKLAARLKTCFDEVLIEPGEFFFLSAIKLRASVIGFREIDDKNYAVRLNASKDCHLKWSEPILLDATPLDSEKSTILIHFLGATCHANDVIGCVEILRADLKRFSRLGAQITFGNISSYSLAWMNSFNGVPKLEVVD